MKYPSPKISTVLLFAIFVSSFGGLAFAQSPPDGSLGDGTKRWPVEKPSVVKTAEGKSPAATEPVMRIALSTSTGAATISTTARLVNVSESSGEAQSLETARIRVESRSLSIPRGTEERAYEIEMARKLSREDADRLAQSIHELAGETVRFEPEPGNTWRVLFTKPSKAEAEEAKENLEEAGFEVLSLKEVQYQNPAVSSNSPAPTKPGGNNSTRLRLTARPAAPTRELVAFARGAAPSFRSSAPLIFASSDEKNAPVRFNEKPYRGKIEVFANTHGAVTVVNVIGLEDYVKGVVPNELSYPALEALKAQAIAARTYALKNRGQFQSEGFDLLPTTRSQVYRGLSSETPLTTRAVDETRGVIATYNGEPINALYTSTCGGRTEDAGNIFNDAIPYLRGRECAVEGKAAFAPFTIKSSRDLMEIKDERDLIYARDAALLAVNGFKLPEDKISSSWLSAHVSESEVRDWLTNVAGLARNAAFRAPNDAAKPPQFSSALVAALFGDNRADTLLNGADADYLLSFRDGQDVPTENRADVAMLVRDGALALFADATLRPKETLSRARTLHAIARMLEAKSLLALQKGTSRPAASGVMMLRSNKGKDLPIAVSKEVFLFREFGGDLYQTKSLAMVGGEPVVFHVSSRGEVDYLQVSPATNGAAADRFSSLTNWSAQMNLRTVQGRLARSVRGIGAITDLRIAKQGTSRRVIDLEVIGTQGVAHIRGGRIRSALGLKEQLFVIDRTYDENNRVSSFTFTGRGWGHGVGMCQFGAYGLAKQGLNVEQILKTYYTGIELTNLY
jgi:stage II sporulation protein D